MSRVVLHKSEEVRKLEDGGFIVLGTAPKPLPESELRKFPMCVVHSPWDGRSETLYECSWEDPECDVQVMEAEFQYPFSQTVGIPA